MKKVLSVTIIVLTILTVAATWTSIGEVTRQATEAVKANIFEDNRAIEVLGTFMQGPKGHLQPVMTGPWIRLAWPVVLGYPVLAYTWYYLAQGGILDLIGPLGAALLFFTIVFLVGLKFLGRRKQTTT